MCKLLRLQFQPQIDPHSSSLVFWSSVSTPDERPTQSPDSGCILDTHPLALSSLCSHSRLRSEPHQDFRMIGTGLSKSLCNYSAYFALSPANSLFCQKLWVRWNYLVRSPVMMSILCRLEKEVARFCERAEVIVRMVE